MFRSSLPTLFGDPMRTLLALLLLALAPVSARAQLSPDLSGLVLRPGDAIQVEIWREPDLSGTFFVDVRGLVVLPLLGEIPATGRAWTEIFDELMERYRRELRNPSVRLTPRRRVHVLGEVNQPGIYDLDPTLSLLGAVALAGGALPQGDLKNLQVVRDGEVILDRVPAESALATVDIRSGDEIFVGRRSWFERNSTFLVSAVLSVTTIIVTLVAR